jgi:hypothetical protein
VNECVEEERNEVRALELFINTGGCLFVRRPSAFDSAKAPALCRLGRRVVIR